MKLKFRKAEGRPDSNKNYLCGGEVQAQKTGVAFLQSERLCQKDWYIMCVIHLRKLTNIDYSKIYFLKKIQGGAFCVDGEDASLSLHRRKAYPGRGCRNFILNMSEKDELKLITHNVECKREVREAKKENITYIADA